MAIACKTTCKGRASERESEREESNVCLAPLRMYAASERADGVGVRLVIICFRVSDPDNGTTDGTGREAGPGWHWQSQPPGQSCFSSTHAKEVRNGTAMQNVRGMRNGSGSAS